MKPKSVFASKFFNRPAAIIQAFSNTLIARHLTAQHPATGYSTMPLWRLRQAPFFEGDLQHLSSANFPYMHKQPLPASPT